MSEIGGYFELELNSGEEYHNGAIRLNLGRTSFEYILRAKKYKKVYLPYYTCDVMLEPLNRLSLEFEFYKIDNNFRPVFDFSSVQLQEVFVYNNYFGICDTQVAEVAGKCKNFIIDNSQAFFSKPLPFVDTFYSPRKFFGVPDGGYLYTSKILSENLETDNSSDRFEHLIGRIENSVEKFYPKFMENEQKLCEQPLKKMSKVTLRLLQNIDYAKVAEIRSENFQYLHNKLADKNILNLDIGNGSLPMIYPFLSHNKNLRDHLITNKVFVPCFWSNVFDWCVEDSLENNFAMHLIPLPIDQRYGINEMKAIVSIIQSSLQ